MKYLDEFEYKISLVDGMLHETGGQFGKRYIQDYIEDCLKIAQKYYEDTNDKNNLMKIVNLYISEYEDLTSWTHYQYQMDFLNSLKASIENF